MPESFWRAMPWDGRLLFLTRSLRMLAFGLLSVVLVLFLKAIGLQESEIGLLLTLSLLGDVVMSLLITGVADRAGRRRMLIVGAALLILVGGTFAATSNIWLLVIVATIGVLSASDKEVGPFMSIEQAALSEAIADEDRTAVFAWYNLAGSMAAAVGSLLAGLICQWLMARGAVGAEVYRPLVWTYGAVGIVLAILFGMLSLGVEAPIAPNETQRPSWFGLGESRGVVLRLAGLFALDAFGGGFILQSVIAYWLRVRFDAEPAVLGAIFFVLNLLAAGSSLGASALAKRIGLVQTMVYTHLPSSVLLMIVPFMPTLGLATLLLVLRSCICEMDVPVRQSYIMSVVKPHERAAAAGVAAVARSLGRAAAPILAVYCLSDPSLAVIPFLVAGGVKIAYDLLLYRAFVARPKSIAV